MNSLLNTSLSMTSREVAELVSKRHSDVKRTIHSLVNRGTIQQPQIAFFDEISNLGLPIQREVYVFDYEHKRDTFILVAQLSPEFTAALVDRWQELESKHSTSTSVATTPHPFKPSFATSIQRYKDTFVVTTTILA